jgi:hypothetical protein
MLCKETWDKQATEAREDSRLAWLSSDLAGATALAIAIRSDSLVDLVESDARSGQYKFAPEVNGEEIKARVARALGSDERTANIAAVVAVRFQGGEPPPELDLPEWREEAVARVATAIIKALLRGDAPAPRARRTAEERRAGVEAARREAARVAAEQAGEARYKAKGLVPPPLGASPAPIRRRKLDHHLAPHGLAPWGAFVVLGHGLASAPHSPRSPRAPGAFCVLGQRMTRRWR